MVRPDMHDPALCEELKNALAQLRASRAHAPAAAQPWEVNSLAPDPTKVSDEADTEAEIAREDSMSLITVSMLEEIGGDVSRRNQANSELSTN